MPVLVTIASFVTTLLGGWAAIRLGGRKHLVLGLAAGLMLGVAAFDLLPEALEQEPDELFNVPSALLAFALGFLALHLVERSIAVHSGHEEAYLPHHHHHTPAGQRVGLLAGSALVAHSFMDGFAIGAAFQVGTPVGAAVSIAVVAHDFADGFNTFTITRLYGNAPIRALALLGADAAAPIAGATATLLLDIPSHVLGLYLGFFAGFLLYLATSDILPEAHAERSSWATLACTVGGTGLMWLVIGLAGG